MKSSLHSRLGILTRVVLAGYVSAARFEIAQYLYVWVTWTGVAPFGTLIGLDLPKVSSYRLVRKHSAYSTAQASSITVPRCVSDVLAGPIGSMSS